MKKALVSLIFLTFLGISCVFSQVSPQSYWKNYTMGDGLANDYIQDVLIEGSSDIWMATVSGLSHFDGNTFTNYTIANSNLSDDNILELELAQNKLWLRTSSGISSFDGTSFTNYTTSNGLLTNSIRGITSTSTDTLWIVSLSGASKFDGTNFTHYPSQSGRDIETDTADNVFILRYSVANNFTFANIYSNGLWSRPMPTGGVNFPTSINSAQLKRTADNELFITGIGGFHVKVSYPLALERQTTIVDNRTASNTTVDLSVFEHLNGIKWIGTQANVFPFLFVGQDSTYSTQYLSDPNVKPLCIDAGFGVLVVGSSSGVYITTPTIKKTQSRVPFSVNELATSVKITDALFSNFEATQPNLEFPKNNGTHGLFSANFMVLAKKSSQANYRLHPPNSYSPSYSPGPISRIDGVDRNFIVKVSAQEISDHRLNYTQPGYAVPQSIADWPAYGDTALGMAKDLAPFIDFNANGCYDPENGDYPIIKGDKAIYWINHPSDESIELEYHWMMYGYNVRSDTSLNRSVFVEYTVINRANTVYDSIHVGLFVDGDLGNPVDDYVGTDSVNDILYFYNGQIRDFSNRGGAYGNNTPALGVKLLSEKLSKSIYFNVSPGVTGYPVTVAEWKNYMNGRWKNGQQLRYGGNGYNSSGVSMNNTTHMFTGDPYLQTGWTEVTPAPGSSQIPNSPGDRRIFGALVPFSLQPNERKSIEIVVGFGQSSDTTSQVGQNISTMINGLNSVESFWNLIASPTPNFATTDSCNTLTSVEKAVQEVGSDLKVYPVPASQNLTIESNRVIEEIQLFDTRGSLTMHKLYNQTKIRLNLGGFEEGIYLLRVKKKGQGWGTKKVILMR